MSTQNFFCREKKKDIFNNLDNVDLATENATFVENMDKASYHSSKDSAISQTETESFLPEKSFRDIP